MKASLVALEITVFGTVQGVGFRPFVYNLACELQIAGSVKNSGGTVVIKAYANSSAMDEFLRRLQTNPPGQAEVVNVDVRSVTPDDLDADHFVILESEDDGSDYCMLPPDTAICLDCESELLNSSDRRYAYPFINCSHCGPRFTIIYDLPYDRPQTTMAAFSMCSDCIVEYKDPANRRFHAQPNACWKCGPQLSFVHRHECAARALFEESERAEGTHHHHHHHAHQQLAPGEAEKSAVTLLQEGGVLAVKALGGFQLMCDARNEKAVRLLRERKRRNGKPLAVMFPDMETLRSVCTVSEEEERLLTGTKRPIVLLNYRTDSTAGYKIAPSVANGTAWLGAMLPYTPLHVLLMKSFGGPLVATSGNHSEEPIAIDNAEALIKLQGLADGFLIHNREIETRFDDSVTAVMAGEPAIIRRARGYAPQPVVLPGLLDNNNGTSVLALGAHLKNTFCLLRGNRAYVSQHVGDLNNIETYSFFEETIWKFQQLFRVAPDVVACDFHPEYLSTQLSQRIAEASGLPLVKVQHHHAHIASCMAEHGLRGPVIGVAFDGSGLGPDGTIWGGEFLHCSYDTFERLGFIQPFYLPGGDAASKHPWKIAVSLLLRSQISEAEQALARYEEQQGKNNILGLRKQLNSNVNMSATTSAGRLFDAVSSLIGVCQNSTYEAEAPMRLEAAAWDAWTSTASRSTAAQLLSINVQDTDAGMFMLDSASIVDQICRHLAAGVEVPILALSFHQALARSITQGCQNIAGLKKLKTVCLSGGVFQNRLLCELVVDALRSEGFDVYLQRRVPCNDGGICVGQSVVALASQGELVFAG